MLRKLRTKLYIDKNYKVSIEILKEELTRVRTVSETLAICPKPTQNNWRGVLTATLGLFPNSTFQIPQYFSKPIYSFKEIEELVSHIMKLAFSKVILSGYPQYFSQIIDCFNNQGFNNVFLIYHGSFSSNREDQVTASFLYEIIKAQKENKIKRIGFVKKGMSESFNKITNVECSHIRLFTPIPDENEKISLEKEHAHIGVFTHDLYRKNIDNQVVASLMLDNSKVHVRKNYQYEYLFSEDRFVYHPYFNDYLEFQQLLGSMDVNLYVSFSECFGQIITESIAMGVPCLAADNSGIFDFNANLHELLVVTEFDDSNSIYYKLKEVFMLKGALKDELKDYIVLLNKKSQESIDAFLLD